MAGGQRQQTLALRKVNQFISKGLITLRTPPTHTHTVCGHGYGVHPSAHAYGGQRSTLDVNHQVLSPLFLQAESISDLELAK